jgi:hypothetical protein
VSVWTALHLLLELHPRVLEVAAAPHQQAAVEEESFYDAAGKWK